MSKKIFTLTAALLLLLVSPVFAELEVQEDGTVVGGSFATQVDFQGSIDASGATSTKVVRTPPLPESVTTDDTLTATETGKTFILSRSNASGGAVLTLPTAVAGLEYHFIDGAGYTNGKAAGDGYLWINPEAADVINADVSGAALGVGISLRSPGNTGDSLALICGVANTWDVLQRTGTWVNGG